MDLGIAEISAVAGISVVPTILDRVFRFINDREEANRRERMVNLAERQTELMERLTPMVESIYRTTDSYEKAGVCPLTRPDGQDRVARAVAREIKSLD